MLATLFTTSVSAIKRTRADEYWLVTRGGGDIAGTVRVKDLAPSPELFQRYASNWKGRPPAEWWTQYETLFRVEMQGEPALAALRRLYRTLNSGRTVALTCYCSDPDHCHRRLLGEFMCVHGVSVVETCRATSLRLL